MHSIILWAALGCAAILFTTWLLTREKRTGARCRCGAQASIIIDQQWYCARHAWERMDEHPPRS